LKHYTLSDTTNFPSDEQLELFLEYIKFKKDFQYFLKDGGIAYKSNVGYYIIKRDSIEYGEEE